MDMNFYISIHVGHYGDAFSNSVHLSVVLSNDSPFFSSLKHFHVLFINSIFRSCSFWSHILLQFFLASGSLSLYIFCQHFSRILFPYFGISFFSFRLILSHYLLSLHSLTNIFCLIKLHYLACLLFCFGLFTPTYPCVTIAFLGIFAYCCNFCNSSSSLIWYRCLVLLLSFFRWHQFYQILISLMHKLARLVQRHCAL